MTKSENRQRIKNEALNKIRRLYDEHLKNSFYDTFDECSFTEQRDYLISEILDCLEYELKNC